MVRVIPVKKLVTTIESPRKRGPMFNVNEKVKFLFLTNYLREFRQPEAVVPYDVLWLLLFVLL